MSPRWGSKDTVWVKADELASKLRMYKKRNDITLQQLAEKTGEHPSNIRHILYREMHTVEYDRADRICTLLNMETPQAYRYELVPINELNGT